MDVTKEVVSGSSGIEPCGFRDVQGNLQNEASKLRLGK